jgi:tetratricopeptide (TPR) repeat protein
METQINLAAGDAKEAVRAASELLERIAKASPDTETSPQLLSELYAKTLVARATTYLEMHDTKSARADFMAARDAAPRFPSSYVNLAAVSLKENKIDEATGYFEQALAIDNTDFDALNGLIENIYTRKHRLDLAHQRIGQALSEQPNSASLHFLKGNIYGHEMNAQNAEAEFRRALEIDPDYLPAYSSLGALFGNMEQPERAIDEYRKILDRNENPSTYTLIGMLEEGRSNFAAASQAYRMALDLDQNSTIAANNLAWMIAVQGNGNLDEAVRLAQGAVQRYPSMPGFADTLGWIYQKKGLYGPAAEQLERAVARDSANATYRYHLGMAFAGKGDKAGARREIEEALRQAGRLSPADADEARKTLTAL